MATGPFQVPFVPPAAQRLDGSVTQLHSAGYRNPQALPPGPVLVVGGGNSGFQIAEELAASRQVDLSIATKLAGLPQRLAGKDLFWWLTRLGAACGSPSSPGWAAGCPAGTSSSAAAAAGSRRPGSGSGPAVAGADGRTVRFADGTSLDAGVVIWATGYRPDYSWIDIPGVIRDGKVVHRRGVTEIPGLYFLGLSWQHTRGSALLGFVHDDAAYLAGLITSHARATKAAASRPAPQRSA